MQKGHIDLAVQLIIAKHEDIDNNFTLSKYVADIHKEVYRIVAVPWVNSENVQLSIGITQYG